MDVTPYAIGQMPLRADYMFPKAQVAEGALVRARTANTYPDMCRLRASSFIEPFISAAPPYVFVLDAEEVLREALKNPSGVIRVHSGPVNHFDVRFVFPSGLDVEGVDSIYFQDRIPLKGNPAE